MMSPIVICNKTKNLNQSNEKHRFVAKQESVFTKNKGGQMFPIFKWSKAQDYNIREYRNNSVEHLEIVHITKSFICPNTNCSDKLH